MDNNNADLRMGDTIFGYRLQRSVELNEIDSFFYELEHVATGAKHVHISNNDKENTFCVAFKTVPVDSTGVAHILEHTVLCGSRKFLVRDPFFSMLKRSLCTFMNAFTASDWTMYPFSTQNKKDYYNLMEVYLDSVFYPNLDELSFKQEGYRLDFENNSHNPGSHKLVYKGVVYNEMKGAMSSPGQVMTRSMLKALYPDTTYGNNSGGDPTVIPTLTHGKLIAFHKRYYHPSNSFFYTYGDLPLKDHLAFLDDTILKDFIRIDPQTVVPSQPRWKKPKKAKFSYPFSRNEDPSRKCQVCVAWLTADIKDSFEVLVLTLLENILLGNSASPLRKRLIDSEVGTALSDGTGFDPDNRDTLFAAGLKGVEESSAYEIEEMISDVLNNLVSRGLDPKLVESAVHQIEFHRKEKTNHPYPYGIKLLLNFSGSWFHGGDPLRILQFNKDLEKLRHEISKDSFLESRIKKYFLDNPHRVLLTLLPDQLMEQKENERVVAELDGIMSGMNRSDRDKICEAAEALMRLQETKEDVSCLPVLDLEDIPSAVQGIEEATSYRKTPSTFYEQPTSDIVYFEAAVGTGALPRLLLPLVPFFCYACSRIGTTMHDYAEMAQRIDTHTGGIDLSSHARTAYDKEGNCVPFITLNGKCLGRNQEMMFKIIEELLNQHDFSDLIRLKSLLLEYRAGMESMIVQNGHRLAMLLASRNFSATSALSESWHGIHQLQTIKKLTDNLANDTLQSFAADLQSIGKNLFTKNNLKIAVIGENHALSVASSATAPIQNKLNEGTGAGFVLAGFDVSPEPPREGWSTSSAVSFVAQTFKTVRMDHEDAPALSAISKMLRSLYLHREIREKGGAYGGFAVYDYEDGLFSFSSYRDPHIVSTLNVFDKATSFIRSGDYRDQDIKEAILQVCAEIDKPDPPGIAAQKAFLRKIISLSDKARSRFKEQVLALSRDRLLKVAEKYFDPKGDRCAVAVISGKEKLNAANEKMPGNPLKLYKI